MAADRWPKCILHFLQKNSAVVNEWVSQVRELERRILFCSRRTNVAQYRLL